MKNKVCKCCFWTICMYCSQNNVLATVISPGSLAVNTRTVVACWV